MRRHWNNAMLEKLRGIAPTMTIKQLCEEYQIKQPALFSVLRKYDISYIKIQQKDRRRRTSG